MPVIRIGSPSEADEDVVAVEEPLQVRLGNRDLAVMMRTPGNDDELAAGFLFTEGILHAHEDIAEITGDDNSITVSMTREADEFLNTRPRAQQGSPHVMPRYGVYGEASVDLLVAAGCTAPPREIPTVDASIILRLPETMRSRQPIFDRTGGLHAASLFDVQGNLQLVREDVGRHNAVAKLVGRSLLDGRLPLNDSILLVSGCASFELVQKALMAGIPVLAALGAPSSLAVEAALRFGMTLVGFVRDGRFQIYSGEARICRTV